MSPPLTFGWVQRISPVAASRAVRGPARTISVPLTIPKEELTRVPLALGSGVFQAGSPLAASWHRTTPRELMT